ncbi:hypothetical protein CIPAW_14G097100 [Carya illinoinensis]|uniref:Uncharacterized protein n=1 Tax=Carya illinoinensis TaxID=32201 RepID=A0A8T1NLF7_CARIL|nr:hypothetical protein CIPAW_14G097100 [Carya illinoinensis]
MFLGTFSFQNVQEYLTWKCCMTRNEDLIQQASFVKVTLTEF